MAIKAFQTLKLW